MIQRPSVHLARSKPAPGNPSHFLPPPAASPSPGRDGSGRHGGEPTMGRLQAPWRPPPCPPPSKRKSCGRPPRRRPASTACLLVVDAGGLPQIRCSGSLLVVGAGSLLQIRSPPSLCTTPTLSRRPPDPRGPELGVGVGVWPPPSSGSTVVRCVVRPRPRVRRRVGGELRSAVVDVVAGAGRRCRTGRQSRTEGKARARDGSVKGPHRCKVEKLQGGRTGPLVHEMGV
jgi:hypothetical protein